MDHLSQDLSSSIKTALEEFESVPLSKSIRQAIRIATLREDHEALYALNLETRRGVSLTFELLQSDAREHVPQEQFAVMVARVDAAYWNERDYVKPTDHQRSTLLISVQEIETTIETMGARYRDTFEPINPASAHLMTTSPSEHRDDYQDVAIAMRGVLANIEANVHGRLLRFEKEILYHNAVEDVFARNRRFVESRLSVIAPEVLDQFNSAQQRIWEGDDEARSQALLSCRRILKSLADHVYPALDTQVVGSDGKEHSMTDDKYINRLWQFVSDAGSKTSYELLRAQIGDFEKRIDGLYGVASKGVHARPDGFEVDQCVIQTWLVIGDILRLYENSDG